MSVGQDQIEEQSGMLSREGMEDCGIADAARDATPSAAESTQDDVVIEIFISEHCFVCDYAHEVAATIERDFPAVTLRMIDLQQTDEPIPEAVFATPTYLLNGKVWSLGNPSPQKVTETLSELVGAICR